MVIDCLGSSYVSFEVFLSKFLWQAFILYPKFFPRANIVVLDGVILGRTMSYLLWHSCLYSCCFSLRLHKVRSQVLKWLRKG